MYSCSKLIILDFRVSYFNNSTVSQYTVVIDNVLVIIHVIQISITLIDQILTNQTQKFVIYIYVTKGYDSNEMRTN